MLFKRLGIIFEINLKGSSRKFQRGTAIHLTLSGSIQRSRQTGRRWVYTLIGKSMNRLILFVCFWVVMEILKIH